MQTIGFPISVKENENRRALIPNDIAKIKNTSCLFFQRGYGEVLGYADSEYVNLGAKITDKEEVLRKSIICDPKIGDADYLKSLYKQTLIGWPHAVQNREIVDIAIEKRLTIIAWEDMFEGGRHIFWRNNEIAGEAAIMHAFECFGLMPYNLKVALIGRGNVGNGALKILTLLGADVTTYNRRTEALLREEISQYDVIVNAVLWDTSRKDHIIYKEDLKRMKKNSLIIDISCDKHGGIESSEPTTINSPIFFCDGIAHYVVDHTPSIFYKTATTSISSVLYPFIDCLCEGNLNCTLQKAKCISEGKIVDERINAYQGRV